MQGDCHRTRCDAVEAHPTCPGIRAAVYQDNSDYYHSTVLCATDPCASEECDAAGEDVACCVENVAGTPCQPVFRDPATSTIVDCSGYVRPCEADGECADGEWCRATEHVVKEQHGAGHVRRKCVAYAGLGTECGGFTVPPPKKKHAERAERESASERYKCGKQPRLSAARC
jgi:hypothetical protein